MVQILGFLLLAMVAIYALKVAIILLFLAGLIFRTKETLALIVVLGLLALLRNYPVACAIVGGLAALIALVKSGSRKADQIPDDPGT